jgi:omega-amidase
MRLTVSLAQIDAGIGHAADNLARATAAVQEAGRRRSDLALLPELWFDGLDYARAAEIATPRDAGAFAYMRQMAMDAGLYLAGSAFERDGEAVYNTLAVITPAGEWLAAYRKLHLFGPMSEDRHLTAGSAPALAAFPWGRWGLAICYDLRFPELFRRYASEGATAILLPAQWPGARVDHWRTLVRARAIENQMFALACNRSGFDDETTFGGRSVICDPWGQPLVEAGSDDILLTAEIDLDAVEEARRRIPALRDRRPDLF